MMMFCWMCAVPVPVVLKCPAGGYVCCRVVIALRYALVMLCVDS